MYIFMCICNLIIILTQSPNFKESPSWATLGNTFLLTIKTHSCKHDVCMKLQFNAFSVLQRAQKLSVFVLSIQLLTYPGLQPFSRLMVGGGRGVKVTQFRFCYCHLDRLGQTNTLTLNEKFLNTSVIFWICLYIFQTLYCQAEKLD